MGRRPGRVSAGGISHVCNCVSRGQHVFRDDSEADRLEALRAATVKREDFQIFVRRRVMEEAFRAKMRRVDTMIAGATEGPR